MTHNPTELARTLQIETFFRGVDKMIVQRLRVESESDDGKAALLRATGIEDDELLRECHSLGITSEGLIVLRLVPLVLVAWSENHADSAERAVIMNYAEELGIQEDSVPGVLLDFWLRKLPSSEVVDTWKRYMHAEFQRLRPVAREKLVELTRQQMLAVAKASGGVMGLGKVSRAERQMIDGLVKLLETEVVD